MKPVIKNEQVFVQEEAVGEKKKSLGQKLH